MLFKRFLFPLLIPILLVPVACATPESVGEPVITGEVVDGLRNIVLTKGLARHLHVYRGDYVNFQTENGAVLNFRVADLEIAETLPKLGEKPYIKFKEAGEFEYWLEGQEGRITVHEFRHRNYSELRATEASELIESVQPFILDVRTPMEFAQGHIEGAELLPIRELQYRVGDLSSHKDEPIFIYCRSGNRSTVAAKILMDQGFERVYNLRYGIIDWAKAGLPVMK